MIKLWRDIRGTTPNIRKIDKSYSIGRNKTDMKDAISAQNFENTDEALKLYNKFHPDEICKSTNQFFLIITGLRKNKK